MRSLILVLALPAMAHAQDSAPLEAIHLSYRQASSDCPDEAYFVAQIRARTDRMALAEEAQPGRQFFISLERDRHVVRGHLRVVNQDGSKSARDMSDKTCRLVVDALALVTALAIDPHARLIAPAPASQPASVPQPIAPPASEPVAPQVAAAWQMSVTANGGIAEGVSPSVAWDGSAMIDLSRLARPWPFSLRAGVAVDGHLGIKTPLGVADLAFFLGRFDGCPARLTLGWGIRLLPCARIDAGAVVARGRDIAAAQKVTRPWIALGVAALVERDFFGCFYVQLELALAIPLVRDQFVFQPQTVIEAIPAIGFSETLGVGVHFW